MEEKKTHTPDLSPEPSMPGLTQATEETDKIWKLNGKFPVLVDYLVFFGIFLLAQAVGVVVALLLGFKLPDLALLNSSDQAVRAAEQLSIGHFNALMYFIAMAVTLAGFLFYRSRRQGPKIVARFSSKGLNPIFLLWGVVFMLAVSVALEPLLSLMPDVPNVYGRGAWAILTLVVMAPLFEEVIFRGVLLESTRAKYGTITAWIISSAIFGIVHLHPTVAVNAFALGLVFGFIYLRTESLWSVIILHAINNGLAYLLLISGHGNAWLIDLVASRTLYVVIYIGAMAILIISGYMMLRQLQRLKTADKKEQEA